MQAQEGDGEAEKASEESDIGVTKLTLFDEWSKRTHVAVLLHEARLRSSKNLLLLVVLDSEQLIVVRVDVGGLVADNGFHVLVLRLLLQVLELEIPQERL